MGQLIMLATLFGLIILIFAVVYRFDPEARGRGDERLREERTATDEHLREERTATDERLREERTAADEVNR